MRPEKMPHLRTEGRPLRRPLEVVSRDEQPQVGADRGGFLEAGQHLHRVPGGSELSGVGKDQRPPTDRWRDIGGRRDGGTQHRDGVPWARRSQEPRDVILHLRRLAEQRGAPVDQRLQTM